MKVINWKMIVLSGLVATMTACSSGGGDSTTGNAVVTDPPAFVSAVFGDCGSGMPVEVPCGFPIPREEENNILSVEKIELGRLLFYDQNMSINQVHSCASCHLPEHAFTDSLNVSLGTFGDAHARNAMSMTNVVYNGTMNWANNQVTSLEEQALAVLLNEDPVELGWTNNESTILARFKNPNAADYAFAMNAFAVTPPDYPNLFAAAFPEETDAITMFTVTKALAAFGSTMISGDSEFDKEGRAEVNTMSASAKRGRDLFFDERFECFHCHGGFNFSDSVDHSATQFTQNSFHNNGAFNVGAPGVREFTLLAADDGKFRAPTLRNIELTAPYMHDGSFATLEDVVDHYFSGGTNHPTKSSFINGIISADPAGEKADLVEFLKSLTDMSFVCRDSLSDPFEVLPAHSGC